MKAAKNILIGAGLNNTFWGERIINAEQNGAFTSGDVSMASDWCTCACGQLGIEQINPPEDNRPADTKLQMLGVKFYGQVKGFSDHPTFYDAVGPAEAARTLIEIEKRAGELYDR